MLRPLICQSLALLSLAATALAQEPSFDLAHTSEVLTKEIEKKLAGGVASISISLVKGGEIVWSAAFGHANVATKTPATPATLYCTGSTFKAVTATALLQLVDAGKMALDDPVNKYLGEHPIEELEQHSITFRHILSHTSGLVAGETITKLWERALPQTLEELVDGLRAVRPPDERWEYNNSAYGLAGYLIESISGQSYEEYITEHILIPLGVRTPAPITPTAAMAELLASPYRTVKGKAVPVDRVRFDVYPAGDAYLTAEDMARFLAAHLNQGSYGDRRILSPNSTREAHRLHMNDYALGWGCTSKGQLDIISHGGGVPGFATYMIGDIENGVGAYIMSNSGNMAGIGMAAIELLRGADWKPREELVAIQVAPEAIKEFVGRYQFDPSFTLKVADSDGKLSISSTGRPPQVFAAYAPDSFFTPNADVRVTFVRDDQMKVTGLQFFFGTPRYAERLPHDLANTRNMDSNTNRVVKTDAEWREQLTPEQYRITRTAGTEGAFTGKYWNEKRIGTYECICCDLPLFRSDSKFDSGCGWPSFFEPLEGANLVEIKDSTLGMVRTEIRCKRCDAHLGHVFNDGPPPTGLRYCINSASIDLELAKNKQAEEEAKKKK